MVPAERFPIFLVTVALLSLSTRACLVDSVCYNDADCPGGQFCLISAGENHGLCRTFCLDDGDCVYGTFCDQASGRCIEADCLDDRDCSEGFRCREGRCISKAICETDDDCPEGFECLDGKCVSEDYCQTDMDCPEGFECILEHCVQKEIVRCPEGMVAIEELFCIDIYEASRSDATAVSPGTDGSKATSRYGVLPWSVGNNAEAQAACEAAGKTLCTESQWFQACRGPEELVYGYGDDYDPEICNGIDKYCYCGPGCVCEDRDPCPFPHCYHECGARFGLDPTGAGPACTNSYGVFDMNGNLWEHVLGGDETRIRGGAYNCSDSERLHRCDYIPATWKPSARGFRCCSAGLPSGDGGVDGNGGG